MGIGLLLFGALVGGLLTALGLFLAAVSFVPALLPAYRRLQGWGDLGHIARLLYRELIERPPLVRNDTGVVTEHFLVLTFPWTRLYYRPLLARWDTPHSQVIRFHFSDGSLPRISASYLTMIRALCSGGRN